MYCVSPLLSLYPGLNILTYSYSVQIFILLTVPFHIPWQLHTCVCVLPTGRSLLIVLDLRHASWPLCKGCRPLLYPAFLLKVFQVVSFDPFILPSITNRTRSPSRRLWPSWTLCLLLITDIMALSSPPCLNTSSYRLCQTKWCLRPFSEATSYSSQASPAYKCKKDFIIVATSTN